MGKNGKAFQVVDPLSLGVSEMDPLNQGDQAASSQDDGDPLDQVVEDPLVHLEGV